MQSFYAPSMFTNTFTGSHLVSPPGRYAPPSRKIIKTNLVITCVNRGCIFIFSDYLVTPENSNNDRKLITLNQILMRNANAH